MLLFKAINYDGHSKKELSSHFLKGYDIANINREDISASSFKDMIITGFSHITHGDKKKIKDYWISTTSDYSIAIDKYLNNPKYNFNGIAVIDLPNTIFSGQIYDNNLKKFGYIDKNFSGNQVLPIWETNRDGIIFTLDMSSPYTISYLASYFWLMGHITVLDGFRPFTYARASKEVLIMGEKIKFNFIYKDEVEHYRKKYSNNEVNDYYVNLLRTFIKYAPDSELKRKVLNINYTEESEYNEYLSNEISYIIGEELSSCIDLSSPLIRMEVMDGFGIDEREIKRAFLVEKEDEKTSEIMKFYENTLYHYEYKKAINRFEHYRQEASKWKYEDKDIIDFTKYEITESNKKLSYLDFLYAYVYGNIYLSLKLKDKYKKELKLWSFINTLYNCEFINEKFIPKDENKFLFFYGKSLGILR